MKSTIITSRKKKGETFPCLKEIYGTLAEYNGVIVLMTAADVGTVVYAPPAVTYYVLGEHINGWSPDKLRSFSGSISLED